METPLSSPFSCNASITAPDPPQLKDRLAGRNLLELLGNGGKDVEVLLDALAPNPADETDLEARTQTPPHCSTVSGGSPGAEATGCGCLSDFRFNSSNVPSDSSALPRTARRSFSRGSNTSARSRPPASTRSR